MNYTQVNLPLFDGEERIILNQYRKAWLWTVKFWQFSLFYGNYLGGLNSRNHSLKKK